MKRDGRIEAVISRIQGGVWQPGERIPGIRTLAAEQECSPATMAQTLKEVAARGYLTGRNRSGYFVTPRTEWGKRPEKSTSPLVGVMLTETTSMLPVMEEELRRRGYGMLVAHETRSADRALRCIEDWRERGVHGIIWSPLSTREHLRDNARLAGCLSASGIPSVAVDRTPPGIEVNGVVSDNAQSACLLTRRLLDLGHRRIGLLRHRCGSSAENRQAGYERAHLEYATAVDPALILQVEHDDHGTALVDRVSAWLKSTPMTAAWSITGNPLGQALLAALQRLEWPVPAQFSLMTFDEMIAPFPVTFIRQPFEEIARRAVALLDELMESATTEIRQIILPSQLIEGASSSAPPAESAV